MSSLESTFPFAGNNSNSPTSEVLRASFLVIKHAVNAVFFISVLSALFGWVLLVALDEVATWESSAGAGEKEGGKDLGDEGNGGGVDESVGEGGRVGQDRDVGDEPCNGTFAVKKTTTTTYKQEYISDLELPRLLSKHTAPTTTTSTTRSQPHPAGTPIGPPSFRPPRPYETSPLPRNDPDSNRPIRNTNVRERRSETVQDPASEILKEIESRWHSGDRERPSSFSSYMPTPALSLFDHHPNPNPNSSSPTDVTSSTHGRVPETAKGEHNYVPSEDLLALRHELTLRDGFCEGRGS